MLTHLKEAALCYEQEEQANYPKVMSANFIVENVNIDGKSLSRINLREIANATLSRVMHNDIAVTPSKDTILNLGDRVRAVGTDEALERVRLIIGKRTDEEIPLSKGYDVQWVLVSNKNVAHKTVEQINLLENYNANITRIRRSGIDIVPKPKSQIRFGDKLMIACDTESMEEVMRFLGNNAKRLSETDFLPIALGIVFGILLGSLKLPLFGGLSFSLGLTGGVLAAAIILSQIGKTGPIIWTMSGSANQLLRRLGLLFFLSAIGTEAGSHFFATISQYGIKLFLVSAIITIVPLVVGTIVGKVFFRINFLLLLGTLAGGMTSTPGLAAIDPMSDCNTPQIAYATVYPIALVFVIICAQIIGKI